MKPVIALACLALGVISAVLVGQINPRQPAPDGPDLPGLIGNDVAYGRDGPAPLADRPAPAAPPWGTIPMPQPETLRPNQLPPHGAIMGSPPASDDALARLQARPAAYQPLAFKPDQGEGVITASLPVPKVPEPGSWLMMVSGLGLVGLGLRRRTTRRHLATLYASARSSS